MECEIQNEIRLNKKNPAKNTSHALAEIADSLSAAPYKESSCWSRDPMEGVHSLE